MCSLQTTLVLQYPAPKISVAIVHLAMMLLRCREAAMIQGSHWWQHCHLSAYELTGDLNSDTSQIARTHHDGCVSHLARCAQLIAYSVIAFTCMVPQCSAMHPLFPPRADTLAVWALPCFLMQ